MKRLPFAILLLGIMSILSGCAVIDFLDGKDFGQSTNNEMTRYDERPQYGGEHSSGCH